MDEASPSPSYAVPRDSSRTSLWLLDWGSAKSLLTWTVEEMFPSVVGFVA